MLHMNYRVDSNKTLVLNSMTAGGGWGREVHIPVDLTPGDPVFLTAQAEDNKFDIFIDGILRGDFPYRPGLPVTSVKRVLFWAYDDSGSQLLSLHIFYV